MTNTTNLRARHNWECVHNTVRVFFTNFGDEQRAHARASAAPEGVCELEALQAVASFGLLSDYVQDGVHELSALCVVPLGPVVAGSALTCRSAIISQL